MRTLVLLDRVLALASTVSNGETALSVLFAGLADGNVLAAIIFFLLSSCCDFEEEELRPNSIARLCLVRRRNLLELTFSSGGWWWLVLLVLAKIRFFSFTSVLFCLANVSMLILEI